MTYCNHIWGATYVTSLNKLMVLQKKIVRIICHVNKRAHTAELFKKLGIIKFTDLNKYLIARFMFKWYKKDLPRLFDGYFILNKNIHLYPTRQMEMIHVPKMRTNFGQQCIRYKGATIWNSLLNLGYPVDVSEAVYVKQVRRSLENGSM